MNSPVAKKVSRREHDNRVPRGCDAASPRNRAERALANPDPESMHAFAVDLAERVSSLLEDMPYLVGVESGIKAPKPPPAAPGVATSNLEQLPTE